MRAKLPGDNVLVNLVQDSKEKMNLCDSFAVKEELLVNYTDKGEQVMILDMSLSIERVTLLCQLRPILNMALFTL